MPVASETSHWPSYAALGAALGAAVLAGPGRLAAAGAPATATEVNLKVALGGLTADGRLPASAAYCPPRRMDPAAYNVSPSVSWSRGPRGTRSYALIMTDIDVPKDLSLINKAGVTLSADTPRVPFVHWLLVDIPPRITRLRRGEESAGFVLAGKPVGPTDHGVRGANVYSFYYSKDSGLAGPRGGYDGPCPPQNDRIAHRYITRIYALDVPTLGLHGVFFGDDAQSAMQGHVLAQGEADATYSALQP
jgi:Raf kinase inhibitor-like YbhB/YbcL family protein